MRTFLLFLVILAISCNSKRERNIPVNNEIISGKNKQIIIYNFYATHRCPSCIAIEENTKKILNSFYSLYLKDSLIIRKSINVDLSENNSIVEKYQVFGSSIYIVHFYKGKESVINLTSDGFKYALRKPELFEKKLRNILDSLLKFN